MKNKKILTWLLLTIFIVTWIWSSYADDSSKAYKNTSTNIPKVSNTETIKKGETSNIKLNNDKTNDNKNDVSDKNVIKIVNFVINLTKEEKESFKHMTKDQQKAFIEKKLKEIKDSLIKPLLEKQEKWKTLSNDEKTKLDNFKELNQKYKVN